MSEHKAIIEWEKPTPDFAAGRYSRDHSWTFDGGAVVFASASPDIIPPPMSTAAGVDPEEAFVASLSSCHMLTFLSVARRAGFTVTRYRDEAVGHMTKNAEGALWVSHVELRPVVSYGDRRPTPSE